jgi:uncharacterized protein
VNKKVEEILRQLSTSNRWKIEIECIQHGNVTVFEHSVNVAETSIAFAAKLPITVNEESLIKGALLHDYFLYDWHDKEQSPGLHGFKHPYIALKNAKEDYDLNDIEKNIILRHMFPLVPIPPRCKEAWIVCVADKYCALGETVSGWLKKVLPIGA